MQAQDRQRNIDDIKGTKDGDISQVLNGLKEERNQVD